MADQKLVREMEKLHDSLGSLMDENSEIKALATLYDVFFDAIQAVKIAVLNKDWMR